MRARADNPNEPTPRRVLLLLNPGAGQSTALNYAQRRFARQDSSLPLDLVVPDPSDQRAQFDHARAEVENGVEAVVVCGGDGMISLGLNLVAGRHIPFGVIPAGSGNDFARAAGITRRYDAALQTVRDALAQPEIPVRAVDALRLQLPGDGGEARWVANAVNIGFDARVNQRANSGMKVPRQLRYLVALAAELPGFKAVGFDVELDESGSQRLQSALLCIQNGATIGGGIPLAPGARLDDGWAEVSHVAPLSRAGLVALFPLLMMGMHRWLRPLTTRRARRIRVRVPGGVPVFADGDEVLSGDEAGCEGITVTVELVPAAVPLLGGDQRQ